MLNTAYGCFICGHIVKENKVVKVYMAGCGNDIDFVHVCVKCVGGVNSGDIILPNTSVVKNEDTSEIKEKHKRTVDNLLKDVDLSKLDVNKNKKNNIVEYD